MGSESGIYSGFDFVPKYIEISEIIQIYTNQELFRYIKSYLEISEMELLISKNDWLISVKHLEISFIKLFKLTIQ